MTDPELWRDARIAEEVRRFVFDDSSDEPQTPVPEELRALGDRVHGPVLDLLADESIRDRLADRPGGVMICEAPFDRACDLLGDAPPHEAASRLAPFFVYPMQAVRAKAARMYGKLATEDALPFLRRAFRDLDERMAVAAMEGLLVAARLGRIPERSVAEMFEEVRSKHETARSGRDEAKLLLAIDRERAVEYLAAESRWQSPPDWFAGALSALAEAGVLVPRNRLVDFIRRLEPGGDLHPADGLLAPTLPLLGSHRDPRDLAALERLLDGPDEFPAQGASEGLLAYHGLHDLEARLERKPRASRTRYEVWYEAVIALDGLVGNGGFDHFFTCTAEDEWHLALEGLEAMGFVERASIARKAVGLMVGGWWRPARRRADVGRRCRRHGQALEELAGRWYACEESLVAGATRFVIAHAEDFR
ncbi:DMP19 family protein [Paludisphaera soli]|uniref:DMP19 family protein n=1 Tax=Paludisphaera soli TaxID=2712865 RepID=UPI0013EA34BD|nr:DUF4375 domain-containing protein [Paludisphaera soli]